ncbi:protease complex subunit PrcB family protein [Paenibacillus sp. yr247]|uniref:protease complex subunit PrcB family protein n=1 Tax=Paenibacillus sp. yr247 TaxID=1761880 RepID=UPI001587BFBB|nr:protease complex subunit PrcB family protein [Paenibacillus sp. yr247]
MTLSRGSMPNAGYGIEINNIRFDQNGQALITSTLRDPQPDEAYADVMTEAKAVTYVSSKYNVVAEPDAVPSPAPSKTASSEAIKNLVESAKKGKAPGVAYAVHVNTIDDVQKD